MSPDGPPLPKSARVIALTNQKGGVGKTTTAVNLAAALAEAQQRVLLIDLDPQGNASTGFGITAERRRVSIYHVLTEARPVTDAVLPFGDHGLSIVLARSLRHRRRALRRFGPGPAPANGAQGGRRSHGNRLS